MEEKTTITRSPAWFWTTIVFVLMFFAVSLLFINVTNKGVACEDNLNNSYNQTINLNNTNYLLHQYNLAFLKMNSVYKERLVVHNISTDINYTYYNITIPTK